MDRMIQNRNLPRTMCHLLVIIFTLVFSSSLFAFQPWLRTRIWHPFVTVTGGALSTTSQGESQTFPIQDPIVDSFYIYSPNDNTKSAAYAELFVGIEWCLFDTGLQLGLAYNQSRPFTYTGSLTQGADVQSQDIFSYQYDITLRQLLAEAKVLFFMNKRYHPYIMGGMGAAFNSAYNYTTTVPPFLTFTRMYSRNTSTSFSYMLGFGLDFDLDQIFRVGVGYRFADFGKAELGSAIIDDTPVSGTLSTSHIYTNQLFAQITCALG